MKVNSIKKHIILSTLLIVFIPVVILGVFSCYSVWYSSINLAKKSLDQSAKLAADLVQWELETFLTVTADTGCSTELSDPNTAAERKQEIIDLKVAQYSEIDRGCAIDAEGMGSNGIDYSDRAYFKNAMNGKTTVTEPMLAKSTGKMAIIIAAPIWENGVAGSTPVGCVYFVPNEDFLNEVVRGIDVSEHSYAFIIDKNGTVIADESSENVENGINYITLSEEDKSYTKLAEVNRRMIAGEQGSTNISIGSDSIFVGFAPVEGTDGWSIAVVSPSMDILTVAYVCIIITSVIFAVAAFFSVMNSGKMGRNIGNPVALCTERLRLLSEGDLSAPVPQVNTSDETKVLADATERLVGDLKSIIGDIGRMLGAMANGDFTVESSCGDGVYKGDFHVLIESVNGIEKKLTYTLSQINTSADMVSSGSEQVSSGAQNLSQGATEQASSIEQLTSTSHTIAEKVSDTAENCVEGRNLAEETAGYISDVSECMEKLTDAMKDIGEASDEISRIIGAIEDIAFQTNILALNAAVEAARAGEAGKGFAVVADEVRNLASKSAEAAQETTALIERAVRAVENGRKITAQTVSAVSDVSERSEKVRDIVTHIADASTVQSDMIKQVTQGMEQISGVVQTNSATAEQSAAASEELSNQAHILKNLVSEFTLKS